MTTLELELVELKARVDRLETTVRSLTGQRPAIVLPPGDSPDQAEILAWLKAEGLIRDPTPEELRLAAEWDALPEVEKQAHINFMRGLVLDPPLSQIIIENRG